jgi:3-oxo-5alpha-steroid 4-dehydrogenase
MSLGGLSVNGFTGQVLRRNGAPIQGLYAAGRSAVGVCSNSYVSGLSVADGIFSGRNAGSAVAEAAAKSKRTR